MWRISIEVAKYVYLRCDVFNFLISRSIKSLEWWNWDGGIVLAPESIDVQLFCVFEPIRITFLLSIVRSSVRLFFSSFLLFNETIKNNDHTVQVAFTKFDSILWFYNLRFLKRMCSMCSNGQTNFYCVCLCLVISIVATSNAQRCTRESVSVCLDKGGKWWSRHKL